MSVARKVEFYISKFNLDVDVMLNPLILTEGQCQRYRLPRTPIKEGEKRKSKFEERFGAGATELDALEALHPGEMGKLLEQEIARYDDPTLRERCWDAQREVHRQLNAIAETVIEPHQDELDQLIAEHEAIIEDLGSWEERADDLWRTVAMKLRDEEHDLSDFELPKHQEVEEPPDALFDSKRDYLTQLDHYHQWQRRWDADVEAEA